MPDNATTMKPEINRIPLGSVDLYIMEWTGSSVSDIPADNEIEIDANFVGRTKDGGEVEYQATWYTAKSDDGKASRSEMTDELGLHHLEREYHNQAHLYGVGDYFGHWLKRKAPHSYRRCSKR